MKRPTLKIGDRGEHVAAFQHLAGVEVDGRFGPKTEARTREIQSRHGLVADGRVGPKTWALFGETWGPLHPTSGPAPSCLAALRDASTRWPGRRTSSDGIMGDARHAASESDHNTGDAFDLSHDPAYGVDGREIAALALTDARTRYVIWSRQIFSRERGDRVWRPYSGKNPHTSHVHVSIMKTASARNDVSPWPWSPSRAEVSS